MIKLIYLLGAGRSGTTALATILGNNKAIHTIGEMHQFYDHLRGKKNCSCGELLSNCDFWSQVIAELPTQIVLEPNKIQNISDQLEYHSSLPKHLLGIHNLNDIKTYNFFQSSILQPTLEISNSSYLLDSAKYLGRYLALKKNADLEITGIYLVRDVRGVVNSFQKKVQSSRKPLSAIFYYLSVNIVAEFIYLRNKRSILKIRYEDLIHYPINTLDKIEKKLEVDLSEVKQKIIDKNTFGIGHIIGGNRLKHNSSIVFTSDEKWKEHIPRHKQFLYYLLAFPIMLINRYKM